MDELSTVSLKKGKKPSELAIEASKPVSLDDKYTALKGSIYLSGIQALVRLCIVQRLRDQRIGLNTAGFVSGYRGSPLGGLDEAFWHAKRHLDAHHVKFNEHFQP